jgi:hypothetical protein
VELHAGQASVDRLEGRHRHLRRRRHDGEAGRRLATESPCDIQTDCCAGSPWKRVFSAGVTSSGVRPYSRAPVWATVPPRARAIAWKP